MTFFLVKGPGWERLGDLDNSRERSQASLFNFVLFKIVVVCNVSRCNQTLRECAAQRHACGCCSHLKVSFSARERSIRFRIIVASSRMSAPCWARVCISACVFYFFCITSQPSSIVWLLSCLPQVHLFSLDKAQSSTLLHYRRRRDNYLRLQWLRKGSLMTWSVWCDASVTEWRWQLLELYSDIITLLFPTGHHLLLLLQSSMHVLPCLFHWESLQDLRMRPWVSCLLIFSLVWRKWKICLLLASPFCFIFCSFRSPPPQHGVLPLSDIRSWASWSSFEFSCVLRDSSLHIYWLRLILL